MKRKKSGFTLIELLAVIVILAIIALIATPIIMGVIEDARKGANKDAALGFGKAVENTIATQLIKCPDMLVDEIHEETIDISNCIIDEEAKTSLDINYQGTKPDWTNLFYDNTNGTLSGQVAFGEVEYNVTDGSLYNGDEG